MNESVSSRLNQTAQKPWNYLLFFLLSTKWKSIAWIFKNGMEIALYSWATGEPLTLQPCGRMQFTRLADDLRNGWFS